MTAGKSDDLLLESRCQPFGGSVRSAFSSRSYGRHDPRRRFMQRGEVEAVAAHSRGIVGKEKREIGRPLGGRWGQCHLGFAVVVPDRRKLRKFLSNPHDSLA